MEDLLGIILFIIFIVYRTMGDRRKGMERNRKPREKQPSARKKAPKAEPAAEFFPPQETVPAPVPFPYYEEGESMEGSSYMEGYQEEKREERALEPEPQVLAEPVAAFPSPAELRQAVIWSEILQKPKALRRK